MISLSADTKFSYPDTLTTHLGAESRSKSSSDASAINVKSTKIPKYSDPNPAEKKSLWQRICTPFSVAKSFMRVTNLCIQSSIIGAAVVAGLVAGGIVTCIVAMPVSLTIKLAECCDLANQGTAFSFQISAMFYGGVAAATLSLCAGSATGLVISVAASPLPFACGLICGSVDTAKGYYNRANTLERSMDDFINSRMEYLQSLSKSFEKNRPVPK